MYQESVVKFSNAVDRKAPTRRNGPVRDGDGDHLTSFLTSSYRIQQRLYTMDIHLESIHNQDPEAPCDTRNQRPPPLLWRAVCWIENRLSSARTECGDYAGAHVLLPVVQPSCRSTT